MLYPFKFKPIFKTRSWGHEILSISGNGNDISIVANGYLAENSLEDLLETYMDELVGNSIFQAYGNYFPLLFKFITADNDSPIVVHPDDAHAAEMEQMGRTEMWYITKANTSSVVIKGLKADSSKDEILSNIENGTIVNLLQHVSVKESDVMLIEPGTIHALMKGVEIAEIQEASEVSYRLYDYDRTSDEADISSMCVDDALEVVSYVVDRTPKIDYERKDNSAVNLVDDEHFISNVLDFNRVIIRDYTMLDSFVVYMCVSGSVKIACEDSDVDPIVLIAGESSLIPASLEEIKLTPQGGCRLLETYIVM